MNMKKFAYPYDPYGTNPECLVPNERHTITPINGTGIGFIIPKAAPYFRKSVILKHVASGRILKDGIDWEPSHHFESASSEKPYLEIFGSMVILDTSLTGTFELMSYQTLGGEFTLDETALLELLANTLVDPRTTTWDNVTYAPKTFDVVAHLQSISDTFGYEELVAAVQHMADTYTTEFTKLATLIQNHAQDGSNPHGINDITVGLERFRTVTRATLEQVMGGQDTTNYVTSDNLSRLISNIVAGLGLTGSEGEVPFFDASGANFGVVAGAIQNKLGIVHSTEEWATQIASRESFENVFNTWRRIAMSSNNPIANAAELQAWEYNPSTDTIRSTVNSATMVGLLSPESVDGDYVFEVEVSSTNSDDDFIGISLGTWMYNGKLRNLTLMRSASNQTTGPTSSPSLRLVYDYAGGSSRELAAIRGFNIPVSGWAGYTQPVKIRARRVGNIVYITTNEPGQAYKPEVSYDLNSSADTQGAKGAVSLGYVAHSQLHSTWKTLQRTGAQLPVVGMHDNKVAEWNGSTYVVGSKTPVDMISRGRYYRNPLTNRSYYAEANGLPVMVSNEAAMKMVSESGNVKNRLVNTDEAGNTFAGKELQMYDGATRRGGIKAEAGKVGITKADGSYYAYFDTNGVLQHWGMNHASDKTLKSSIFREEWVDDRSIRLWGFNWKASEHVVDNLWGKSDMGVLAQDVIDIYPECASTNPATGKLSVDYGKLAVVMHLNHRMRPLSVRFSDFVRSVRNCFKK